MDMTPIKYMGFYDVPLIFIMRYRGENYLFDCPFDDEKEDDSDSYKVYLMPDLNDQQLPKDWTTLHTRAVRYLGDVLVSNVRFDPSRRNSVDASVLDAITARRVALG
jgi:hypothetical protein